MCSDFLSQAAPIFMASQPCARLSTDLKIGSMIPALRFTLPETKAVLKTTTTKQTTQTFEMPVG